MSCASCRNAAPTCSSPIKTATICAIWKIFAARLSDSQAADGDSPRRAGRRHRREPRASRRVLLRQPDDERAAAARELGRGRSKSSSRWARSAATPSSRPCHFAKRPLEWIPGRDERAVRLGEKDAARAEPVVPCSSMDSTASS